MFEKLWDYVVDSSMAFFLPLVCAYFSLSGSLFFNVARQDAVGLERISNQALAPFHYIFMGRTAVKNGDGEWEFNPRFNYEHHFGLKTAASALFVVPGFIVGTAAKTATLLQKEGRESFQELKLALQETKVRSNNNYYATLGIAPQDPATIESIIPEGHIRRPGDENHLAGEKRALKDITSLLTKANITWWIDCGTCLGAYRYGGVIPWDEDIDIAVLLPDFDNVCRALNDLDPMKYIVQDWSSRDHPKSYLKVYVRESNTLIDIYHFAIDAAKREINYILALEHAIFFPEWWKIRERRFQVPASFDIVFPLKKAIFDGIEVFVPNDTKKYLQRYYGENLAPAKLYDPQTCQYEKDLSHPYWQRAYAH